LTERPLERMLWTMGKSNAAAANVIDLEAFRQKKVLREAASMPKDAAVLVPVWVCWVPVWAPIG